MSPNAIRPNQEFFDLLAGDIFARLYTHFPEPIDIHSDGIFYNQALKAEEGFEDDPERLQTLYGHTVEWLAKEGYLRFGQVATQDADHVAFLDCVLTSKGLAALRKTPGSLETGETIGDKIRKTAMEIGSDSAKATMKKLVGVALGWIFGA